MGNYIKVKMLSRATILAQRQLILSRTATVGLLPLQSMAFHPKWVRKYRDVTAPTWFDNVNRRWDSASFAKRKNTRSMDPLFLDHEQAQSNGGIEIYLERIHDKSLYALPAQNKAFILYNLV